MDDLKNHFTNYHAGLPSLTCGKCSKNFIHKTSLIRHIANHIHDENENSDSSESSDNAGQNYNEDRAQASDDFNENVGNNGRNEAGQQAGPNIQPQPQLNFELDAAKFLLKLRASGNLTNTSIQMIVDNVSLLLQNVMHQAQEKTRTFMNSSTIAPEDSEDFLKSGSFDTSSMFEGLKTIDEQLEFYCDKFGLVIPEELYLGTRIENRFNRENKMFVPTQVNETFQYVSLIKTLTQIVRNDFLRNLILNESPSEDGVYRTYKDGTDFANNSFLHKYPHSLRLVLYYDGLEIANALGSKDVIHSLGCFYFSIQNLPPEESSLLSSIFLLALCHAVDLKKPGAYGKVLAKFIAELKLLQSDKGVETDLLNGEKFILRACLCTLTADTLAAHEILGFFSSSGADKFCRICLISKTNLKDSTTYIGTLRTSELHEQHVQEVERRPASAKLYGLAGRSPLASVMRVPQDSVFDVFHDMVGVIQMILKLTLYEFIMVQELFNVNTFNANIDSFLYGKPDIKNKPSSNFTRKMLSSKGFTLKQYGSQTFCLLRVFPFLIKGVSESNKHLKLVFLLQDILKIVCSFELKESDIIRLEALLYQFGTQFHEIFISPGPVEEENMCENLDPNDGSDNEDDNSNNEDTDAENEDDSDDADDPRPRRRRRIVWKSRKLKKGINKIHHIAHYPQQIREKGPIIRLWCAR